LEVEMSEGILSDTIVPLMKQGLDVSQKRQNILSSNVANIETPNYTPKDVDFDEALKGRVEKVVNMDGTTTRHFEPKADPEPVDTFRRPDKAPGPDGNSVDLDTQMARVAQNSMLYSGTTKVISKKLATLKYVVNNAG
jgi:flagellar basal-body rod protein FlgB